MNTPFNHVALSTLVLAMACTKSADSSDTADAPSAPIEARPPLAGELLISQLYTSGAAPAGGTDHYFSDQFIELVNAVDVPLDLSGIRIANVYGMAGAINPGSDPDSFREERPDEVVMSTVWRLPVGTEPGEKEKVKKGRGRGRGRGRDRRGRDRRGSDRRGRDRRGRGRGRD